MNQPATLQTHFELRKTRSLSGTRPGLARVFEYLGRVGLCDASGALWPVVLQVNPLSLPVVRESSKPQNPRPAKDHGLFAGDVIRFEASFFRPDGANSTKYKDAGYALRIEAVSEVVRSTAAWEVAELAAPVPSAAECAEQLAAFEEQLGTVFFRTATHARARRLRSAANAYAQVRAFFAERGFLEIDAPSLVASGGVENYLGMFKTHYTDHRGREHELELPTSPEFALKRVLVEGHTKVFSLAKAFRNRGELSRWHEPEFRMLEWYRTGATLADLLEDTRTLVGVLAELVGDGAFENLHWPVFSVPDLFAQHGLDLEALQDPREFAQAASGKAVSVRLGDDWNDTFCKVFMDLIEPEISQFPACFIVDYPKQQAVLAAPVNGKPFVKRFEGYLRGIEICNGFQELTDTHEIERLFGGVQALRSDVRRDVEFENAMRYGLPPCAGNALGIERVIAILCGYDGIGAMAAVPFLARAPRGEIAPE